MDSYIREIITLQIGHYSNFIGSHWLNLQEASFVYNESQPTDINHDYLFREGKLLNNEILYTPRLLIIDAKGSLCSLPQSGMLYEPPLVNVSSSQALWSGNVHVVNQIPEEKNEYQRFLQMQDAKYVENLDEDKDVCSDESTSTPNCEKSKKVFDLSNKVKVWSDFLRPHLHHKTIYLMREICHQDNTSVAKEDDVKIGWSFQEGIAAMKRQDTNEEICDRIRLLSESSGSLQGFHLLCDGHDGMGGVGAMVAEHLADEYTSKELFSFVSNPPHYKPQTLTEHASFLTNTIQCYTELSKHSSVLLPLNLRSNWSDPSSEVVRWPFLSYRAINPYESSSIFASFMDTITVPWRTKNNPVSMSYVSNMLTPVQRKIIGGALAFPIGLEENSSLNDWFSANEEREIYNKIGLNPVGGGYNLNAPKIAEIYAVRGINSNMLERVNFPKKRMKFANAWQLFEHYLTKTDNSNQRRVQRLVSGVRDSLTTTAPFPQIFSKDVNCDGLIKSSNENIRSLVEMVPSAANIYQGEGIGHNLRKILEVGRKINIVKLPEVFNGLMEKEVWDSSLEEFLQLTNAYEDKKFISNEDSDSD
ncbi:UNVERIFIED_CONTAM: hypothetical protein RMT77_005420 [Armadillidium vulgare]|nr:Protein misato-like protein 1 [Armadillidium vulgare]